LINTELPWKAFALGVSMTGLMVSILNLARPEWSSGTAALLAVVTTLAAGAACALLTVYLKGFARWFLSDHRADVEVRQYAESLFLSRELFATRQRTGILLLVSLFERQVIVLPDTGLRKRLSRDAMQEVIARMAAPLASGQVTRALEEGLKSLEDVLAVTVLEESGENELPEEIIVEKGL